MSKKNLAEAWRYVRVVDAANERYVCLYPVQKEDGNWVECNATLTLSGGAVTNLNKHLSKIHNHGKGDYGPLLSEAPSTQQSDIRDYMKVKLEDPDNLQCLAWAASGLSFRLVQCEHFRRACCVRITNPKTLAKRMIVVHAAKLKERLDSMKGETVTLAYDSGTVWRRWLAVMVISPNHPPFLVGLLNAASFEDGSLRTHNVKAYLQDRCELLKEHGVRAVALVADNAGNMQGARINGTLQTRCAAHIIALMVADITSAEECWLHNTVKLAEAIYSKYRKSANLPAPAETRWNSTYRLMLAILVKLENARGEAKKAPKRMRETVVDVDAIGLDTCVDADREEEEEEEEEEGQSDDGEGVENDDNPFMVDEDTEAQLTRACAILSPFHTATNFLQSNSATVFDAVIVFGTFLECYSYSWGDREDPESKEDDYVILEHTLEKDIRKPMLCQDAYLIIAYFHPGTPVERFPSAMSTRLFAGVKTAVQSLGELAPNGINALLEDISRHDTGGAPTTNVQNFTRKSYLEYWKATPYAELTAFLEVLTGCAASEACVERVFSELKFVFRSNRSRSRDQTIAAQCSLKSLLIRPAKEKPLQGGERFEGNHIADVMKSREASFPAMSRILEYFPGLDKAPPKPKVGPAQGACKMCSKFIWQHSDPNASVLRCSKCYGVYVKGCLKLRDFDSIVARCENGIPWLCSTCNYRI